MGYRVKAVADLAGVSVRTLHHYDRIGLLEPTSASAAGYRIYTDPDLERLQQILFFRELGFELKQIREILDSPEFDRRRALRAHRELLSEKRQRIDRLIESVDRTLALMDRNQPMEGREMFEPFDASKLEEQIDRYRDEAIESYGKEKVEESERRVRELSQGDWDTINEETVAINNGLAALMETHQPGDAEVQHYIQRWFDLLNRYFSDYSPESFRGLGDLYVNDDRFTDHFDQVRPGLSTFFRDAMHVFADRAGAGDA